MLNSAPDILVKNAKREIKDLNNNDKITFYTFKILNAQFSRNFFYNNLPHS
jgi:hypothetical protein